MENWAGIRNLDKYRDFYTSNPVMRKYRDSSVIEVEPSSKFSDAFELILNSEHSDSRVKSLIGLNANTGKLEVYLDGKRIACIGSMQVNTAITASSIPNTIDKELFSRKSNKKLGLQEAEKILNSVGMKLIKE